MSKKFPTSKVPVRFAKVWAVGTVITLVIAWLVWKAGYENLAAVGVMLSPFPFPGPIR